MEAYDAKQEPQKTPLLLTEGKMAHLLPTSWSLKLIVFTLILCALIFGGLEIAYAQEADKAGQKNETDISQTNPPEIGEPPLLESDLETKQSPHITPNSFPMIGLKEDENLKKGKDSSQWLRKLFHQRFHSKVYLLEHWQWLSLIGIFLLSWLLQAILVSFLRIVLKRLLGNQEKRGFSQPARAISRAIGLFFMATLILLLIPALCLEKESVSERVLYSLVKLVTAMGIIRLCFHFADVASDYLDRFVKKTDSKLDDQLAPMIRKSLKILITAAAVLFVLDNLQVDVISFLAGLGVVGIGVGLAAKDTFANLFGSLTVFADKPFQIGDWVIIGGVEGTVEEIGFRSTRVRTFPDSIVSVPNSRLVDSPINNMGRRQFRRFKTYFHLGMGTSPEKVEEFCKGIRETAQTAEDMRNDYALVHLNDVTDYSLKVLVYVFFEVPDWGAELAGRQNFLIKCLEHAKRLGIELAYPTQKIHMAAEVDPSMQQLGGSN